jgi:hypothetical protein
MNSPLPITSPLGSDNVSITQKGSKANKADILEREI